MMEDPSNTRNLELHNLYRSIANSVPEGSSRIHNRPDHALKSR